MIRVCVNDNRKIVVAFQLFYADYKSGGNIVTFGYYTNAI